MDFSVYLPKRVFGNLFQVPFGLEINSRTHLAQSLLSFGTTTFTGRRMVRCEISQAV